MQGINVETRDIIIGIIYYAAKFKKEGSALNYFNAILLSMYINAFLCNPIWLLPREYLLRGRE